jgi:ribosome-binding factor A
VTPELIFELDRGAEHSQKISDLLESLNGRDESS